MEKQDYYKNTVEQVKELIKTNPMQAYKKLEEELNMPYIPEVYEVQFNSLLQDLRAEMLQNINVNNELSRDDVIDILLSNDEFKIPMALGKLAHLHIGSMLKELDKVFASKQTANIIKTVIYEYCVEQEIDHKFKWNGLEINPKIVGSVVYLTAYSNALEYIENNISQNPSLKEVAFKHLEIYSLKTFPQFIDEKEEIGPIMVEIAHDAMGIPFMGANNLDKINKIKEIIKK